MNELSPLFTERLVLTRPTEEDGEDLHRLLSDPGVWEHYPTLRHTDPGATEAWVRDQQSGWDRATERLGLTQAWRGHDVGNPDENAVRLMYADRALDEATIEFLLRAHAQHLTSEGGVATTD